MSPILSRLASTGIINSIGGINIGRRRPAVGGGLVIASGGTQTDITVGGINYRLHTFTTVGNSTFTISSGTDQIDVFIVGGGGGGGMLGGGGAGGGIIWASATNVAAGNYTITVGDGGAGEVGWTGAVRKGGSSSAFGLTSLGGGGGLSYSGTPPADTNTNVANTGGNKYAQTGLNGSATTMTIGGIWTGTAYGGYLGGGGDSSCCSCRGGGGAGAGANGSGFSSRNGGIGVQLNFDGNNYYWSGGGGNDGYCTNTGGNGGLGGGGGGGGSTGGSGGGSARNTGGTGASSNGNANGGAGGSNTGGGGGAGSNGSGSTSITGGKGGSGIVMIRYRY